MSRLNFQMSLLSHTKIGQTENCFITKYVIKKKFKQKGYQIKKNMVPFLVNFPINNKFSALPKSFRLQNNFKTL